LPLQYRVALHFASDAFQSYPIPFHFTLTAFSPIANQKDRKGKFELSFECAASQPAHHDLKLKLKAQAA